MWIVALVLVSIMLYFGITNEWGLLGYGFWSFIIAAIILGILESNQNQNILKDVDKDYQDALSELKNNPGNTDLRQKALQAGRAKANITRSILENNKKASVTLFDEVSIRNDLDAIASNNSSPFSYADELGKLNKLKDDGIISTKELSDIKDKISINSSGVNDAIRLLRGLKDLADEGALSESEYNMKKWEILSKKLLK